MAIGVLAPFAEEVVFRGAVLRTLLGLMSKKNHWVATVSYTHLDVYKRQRYIRSDIHQMRNTVAALSFRISFEEFAHLKEEHHKDCLRESVSYTHLVPVVAQMADLMHPIC